MTWAGQTRPGGLPGRARAARGDAPLDPARVVAFEDTEAGVLSATAAGMPCIAVSGTHPHARLGAAQRIVPAIDLPLIEGLLACGHAS